MSKLTYRALFAFRARCTSTPWSTARLDHVGESPRHDKGGTMTTLETAQRKVLERWGSAILGTAIEGGVNYWAHVTDCRFDSNDGDYVSAKLHESDVLSTADADESPVVMQITHTLVADFLLGLHDFEAYLRSLGCPRQSVLRSQVFDLVEGIIEHGEAADWDFDATDADAIVQLMMFEDVVYG